MTSFNTSFSSSHFVQHESLAPKTSVSKMEFNSKGTYSFIIDNLILSVFIIMIPIFVFIFFYVLYDLYHDQDDLEMPWPFKTYVAVSKANVDRWIRRLALCCITFISLSFMYLLCSYYIFRMPVIFFMLSQALFGMQ